MFKKVLVLVASASVLSACATTYSVTPIDTGAAKVTYSNGRPTTDLEQANGAIKVTPLGVAQNGRLNFAVAGYNKLGSPSNFGSENCAGARAAGAAPLRVGEPGYRSGLDRDGDGVACER